MWGESARTSHGLGEFDAHLPETADTGNADNAALAGLVPTQRVWGMRRRTQTKQNALVKSVECKSE